jgi:hypothetical protein
MAMAVAGCFKARVRTPENLVPRKIQIGGPGGSWDVGGRADLGRFLLIGYDSLAQPDKPVTLAARVVDNVSDQPVADVSVGFYRGRELLGVGQTDSDGLAQVAWTPTQVGTTRLDARVVEVEPGMDQRIRELPDTPMRITCLASDAAICLVDTDRTFFDGPFRKALGGKRPDSKASKALAAVDRRFALVYLVEDPVVLSGPARRWLRRHSMPDAPMLPVSHDRRFGDVAYYKTGDAAAIKRRFPNVVAGVAGSSAQAGRMLQEGLRTILIVHYEDDEADEIRDAIQEIRGVRGRGRLEAVQDWEGVQRALADRERFDADELVRDLQTRARKLEEDD